MFDFVESALKDYPKDDFLASKIDGRWVPLSTQYVLDKAKLLAAGLIHAGLTNNSGTVEQRDKVALISRNRPEWLILDLACQMAGIILCPIYPTTNVQELEFIFNDAEVRLVFVSGAELVEKVNTVKGKTPALRGVYSFDEEKDATLWTKLLENIPASALQKANENAAGVKAGDCATIIYTSGTTGTPKGVMLSHHNIVSNVINAVDSFPFALDPLTRAISFLPLNHIFERMISYLYIRSGTGIYYAESLETLGDNLKEVKPHVFCTVPRLLEKVYERIMDKAKELDGAKKKLFYWAHDLAEQYDNRRSNGLLYNIKLGIANKIIFSKWREGLGGNVKYVITGSAAAPIRLIRIFSAAGIPIYEGYGPTENSPVITVNRQEKGGAKFGTVGPPIKGQEVKLAADGEILVKGPSVMLGYYKRPDLTAETVIDGWLHTGDIGVWEDEKFLRITDRKKELFKTSGGKYVAPQPLENRMKESPFIEQMMVLGAEKKFVSALIVPSMSNLRKWMTERKLNFTTPEDAVKMPEVRKHFKDIVEGYNKDFNHVEQVKKFELLPREWTIDSGELTPTLKMKRKVIMERYKDVVEDLYN